MKGHSTEWANNAIVHITNQQYDHWMTTYEAFVAEVYSNFGDATKVDRAQQSLLNFYMQPEESVLVFKQCFLYYSAWSQYNDPVLLQILMKGVCDSYRTAILNNINGPPTTLDQFWRYCRQIELNEITKSIYKPRTTQQSTKPKRCLR